ncbi:RNA polymerase sigma factor [Parapedobacter sp. 2B3]|uniref:RNA polymerase sigma factor n=1 Tax=Parapedobacter sp. 2B3 TaxID=3342381 RepID=UPI0035B6710F
MGNTVQFTEVYNTYFRPLCYFSQRYLGSRDQAEDAVAEVFTKLWRQRTHFHDIDHARSYLYRAAYNTCYTLRKAADGQSSRETHYIEQSPDADESYEHHIVRAELWAQIYRAIHALPTQCSKVMQLSYLEGLTNEEIAQELDLAVQTVKNHKQRGLAILRATLSRDAYLLLVLCVGLLR